MHVTLSLRYWTERNLGLEFGENFVKITTKIAIFQKISLPAFLHNFRTYTIIYFSDPIIKISWEKFGLSWFVEFLSQTLHAPLRPCKMEFGA